MASTRVLLSFKDNQKEQELLKFLSEQSVIIGKGAYIKQLLEKEMNKKNLKP